MNYGDTSMLNPATMGAIAMGVAGVGQVASGVMQMQQSKAQAQEVINTAVRQAGYNAKAAEAQAAEKARQIKALASRQRSQFAAAGLDMSGSALDVITETYTLGQQDIDELLQFTNVQNQELMYGASSQARSAMSKGRSALFGGVASGIGSFGAGYSMYNAGITNVTGTAKTGGNVKITNASYTGK